MIPDPWELSNSDVRKYFHMSSAVVLNGCIGLSEPPCSDRRERDAAWDEHLLSSLLVGIRSQKPSHETPDPNNIRSILVERHEPKIPNSNMMFSCRFLGLQIVASQSQSTSIRVYQSLEYTPIYRVRNVSNPCI